VVIPADHLLRDLSEGFDPSTLKLLYSVSDQEQGQFFATKGCQTERVEQAGLSFYRAVFNERFTFTLGEEATDVLQIKVFMTMAAGKPQEQQASPLKGAGTETSERLVECLKFRLKDNLLKFFDQREAMHELKQTKCKMAIKGLWLHS